MLSQRREEAAVKARGRWVTETSIRRYTKYGKIQRFLAKTPTDTVTFGRAATEAMDSVLRGSTRPLVPAGACGA